jgi:hypothetical protein
LRAEMSSARWFDSSPDRPELMTEEDMVFPFGNSL